MNTKLTSLLGTLLILGGCSNVLWVKEDGTTSDSPPKKAYPKVGGVPFYVKKQQFTHTSTYQQTWIRATLLVKRISVDNKTGKQVSSSDHPIIKNLAKDQLAVLDPVRTAILNADADNFDSGMNAIKTFQDLKDVGLANVKEVLVANDVRSEVVVDYEKKYYLNAPLPWFGTGNLSQKLSGDGTLTDVTSNPDTKLSEGLAALLPLKEYLTGEFVKSGTEAAEDPDTEDDVELFNFKQRSFNPAFKLSQSKYKLELTLKLEEVGYEYVLSRNPVSDRPKPIHAISFVEMADGSAYFTRKEIGGEEKEGKKDDKDETRKIAITGAIILPKDPESEKDKGAATEPK